VSSYQYSNILVYPTRCNVTQFIYIWKLLYMFRVVLPLIIRSAYNCIYSIWYLLHHYCYLPLSWKCWHRFGCAVGGVRRPQHTQTCFITLFFFWGGDIGEEMYENPFEYSEYKNFPSIVRYVSYFQRSILHFLTFKNRASYI
jgi:hypothetical protein